MLNGNSYTKKGQILLKITAESEESSKAGEEKSKREVILAEIHKTISVNLNFERVGGFHLQGI